MSIILCWLRNGLDIIFLIPQWMLCFQVVYKPRNLLGVYRK